jgi:hypothetical protein
MLSAVGDVWRVVTASAYRQARQKVQPEVFVHLNAVACEEYYTRYGADHEVALWHGQRVLGGGWELSESAGYGGDPAGV